MSAKGIKPLEETVDILRDQKAKNPIYKIQSDEYKGEALARQINARASALQNIPVKVDFHNIEDVKKRVDDYLQACSLAESFPSVMGLATFGFGVSRQALSKFLLKYPSSESAQYIEMAKDMIADILVDASLKNNANSIQAIFQLKNHFNHVDSVNIQAVAVSDPLGEAKNADELKSKYLEEMYGNQEGNTTA